MTRIILFVVLFYLIYGLYLYLGNSKVDHKAKQRFVTWGAAALIGILIYAWGVAYWSKDKVEQQILAQGFTATENGQYRGQVEGYGVELQYVKGGLWKSNSVSRLVLVLTSPKPFNDLASFFCDPKEYQRYLNASDSGYYPTPEIKLANQRMVGKCYPQDKVRAVAALPPKTHLFQPVSARYLYLPDAANPKLNQLEIYTEDLDGERLLSHLQDFIQYYNALTN